MTTAASDDNEFVGGMGGMGMGGMGMGDLEDVTLLGMGMDVAQGHTQSAAKLAFYEVGHTHTHCHSYTLLVS